ncbi:hypothetical protein MATR_37260 [Marivirga tractuosa]|uniref:Lipoprotein n=2 Tax=Marivirga TaxID=869806 RepID=E4TN14_MARTH|nr:hypothetical protein Ftrac_2450 [Marivirga tractuosa DSM 4126]BDD16901.1 hypothetical protein MATR_37260 [Marivirga tractuosa]
MKSKPNIMKSHFNYFLLFLSFVFIASSCQKEDIKVEDELPPITQEGLNTFGCKIDGEVLVPKDGFSTNLFTGGTLVGLEAGYPRFGENPVKNYFYIRAGNFVDQGGDIIYLHLQDIDSTGEFELFNSTGNSLYENTNPYHSIIRLFDNSDNESRYFSFEKGGVIRVTRFDTLNHIASGTFEFDIVKESDPLSDTISVTDGRFDINWNTLNEQE